MLVLTLTAPAPGEARLALAEAPLHLDPLPLVPVLLGLADALAAALAGARSPGLRLDAGYRLALTPDGPTGLSISVRRPAGPTLARRQPLAPTRLQRDLLRWIDHARVDPATSPTEAEALREAAWRLQRAPHPRRTGPAWPQTPAAPTSAPRIPKPSDPVAPTEPLDGLTPSRAGLGPAAASTRVPEPAPAAPQAPPPRPEPPAAGPPALSQPLDSSAAAAPPLPVGGLFHLAYRRRWRAPVEALRHAVLVEDTVWLTDAVGLTAIDREAGRCRWQRPGWQGLGPHLPGLALDADGQLVRPHPSRPWLRPDLLPPRRLLCPPAAPWILVCDDHLEAVDPETGAARWRGPADSPLLGAALGPDGLWLATEGEDLRCLDPGSGVELARLALPGEATGAPVPWAEGLIAITQPTPGHAQVSGWARGTPQARWTVPLPEAPLDVPRVDGPRLLVVTGDPQAPRLWALDLRSGALCWQIALPGGVAPPRLRSTPQGPVAKALDGATLGLDPERGHCRWTLPADDRAGLVTHNPPPLSSRGLLIIAAATVRAVDPATGRVAHTLRSDGLLPDRIQVWPNGDVLISEPDGAAYFALEGHLALLR